MTPVSSTLTSMYQKYNNGSNGIAAGLAIGYDQMELRKGPKSSGGILNVPLVLSLFDRAANHVPLTFVVLIVARADESIHRQMSGMDEYLWDDYFSLRADVTTPACDSNINMKRAHDVPSLFCISANFFPAPSF